MVFELNQGLNAERQFKSCIVINTHEEENIFSFGKDSKQSSKGTSITFLALAAAAGGRGHTSEGTQGMHQGIHCSPTSHSPAAAAAPPPRPGSGLRQLPALPTRERKNLQIGSDRCKCLQPRKIHIFSVF